MRWPVPWRDLPLLFWSVNATGELLGPKDIPSVTLALFHTAFNIPGVLLMWPVSRRLAREALCTEFVPGKRIASDLIVANKIRLCSHRVHYPAVTGGDQWRSRRTLCKDAAGGAALAGLRGSGAGGSQGTSRAGKRD